MNDHPPRDMGIRRLDVPLFGTYRPINQPRTTTTTAAPARRNAPGEKAILTARAMATALELQAATLELRTAHLEQRIRLAEHRRAAAARAAEEASWEVEPPIVTNVFGDIRRA
jgi:hypothetical protein|nr:hypothetical protein [Methanoculleus marisnigri]